MADAAGAFVTRSFERMLKESQGKKYTALQTALREYLDRPTAAAPAPTEEADRETSSSEVDASSPRSAGSQAENAAAEPESPVARLPPRRSSSQVAAATMAEAGSTLELSEAELVLQPLRLAMETKQPKLVDAALDCLHKLISYGHLEGEAGIEGGKNGVMLTDIINKVCLCADSMPTVDSTVLQVIKVLLTAVASSKFKVHGDCLNGAIRICYSIVVNSKSHVNQATAKATLTQMINIVFKRMEAESQNMEERPERSDSPPPAEGVAAEQAPFTVEQLQHMAVDADIKGLEAALDKAVQSDGGAEGINLETLRMGQKEALVVFRMLCKLSMKDDSASREDMVIRSRILALELLQGLLESVNHLFTINLEFIDSVKIYLCYALLRACLHSNPAIFQLACGIFMALLLRFRESLKAEIGVFFPLIVLRPLDSVDVSLQHRTSLLKMLEKLCVDPQMLADVFVNYDCDLDASNLFERMVSSLSKVAQGTVSTDPNSLVLSQNPTLKGSALQCLVNVLKSLTLWTKRHDDARKHQQLQEHHESAAQETADFEKAKAHKSSVEAAVLEFNRSPAKGVELLLTSNIVEREPAAIARFLRTTPGLDKTAVGSYLGHHDEFQVAVMHAYVDTMSFTDMKFDEAIREFLKDFRLPGEAQKIDRFMEKFAEKYCRDNPSIFERADTAYVLAYTVIMLNTDAHNAMVWPKMSKEEFVRMNTDTDSEEHPPVELLEEVYDSIVRDEIKLKDDGDLQQARKDVEEKSRLVAVLNLGVSKRKTAADAKKENEEIIRRTQALFKQAGAGGRFYKASHREVARPMLEAVGWPLLAAFSVTMEDSETKPRVTCCMEGFRFAIHLSRELGMDTLRYALLTSLIRFTFLHAPKDMRSKNVEALKTLLGLAENDPTALQDAWNAVLECVSRLEHITSSPSILATLMHGSNQISRDALAQSLIELTLKPTEQVFLNSAKLPSDVIVEFFTALCGVSAEELKQVPPRLFSLQKLVEISYYNMGRIRMVWARIWVVLSQHFVAAGSHYDEKVAMYAIDSLRQLGMKYFERTELASFSFQADILKPFVVLMKTSKSSAIRGLIVDCIVQMVKIKVGNVRSGWKSVFQVYTAAADDTEAIAELAFENVEQVILENFDQVSGDCFIDCVNCLITFANNKTSTRLSLKAISLLRICEVRLAEGRLPGLASRSVETVIEGTDSDVSEHYWIPMLAGLADLTSDTRLEVRNCALDVLFDMLRQRGHKFSKSFWKTVFLKVLFPMFEYVRHEGKNGERPVSADLWLRETCIHSLQLLCDLFSSFYKDVSFLFPSLLELLLGCVTRPDQSLAAISVKALLRLTDLGGDQFSPEDWTALLDTIRDACYTTQPVELLNPENSLPENGRKATADVAADWDAESQDSGQQQQHSAENNGDSGRRSGRSSFEGRPDAAEAHEAPSHVEAEGFSATPPAADEAKAPPPAGGLTLGRRLVGNMMDAFLKKNLSFKGRGRSGDRSSPPPPQVTNMEEQSRDEEAKLQLPLVRTKALAQLLLLESLEKMQEKHWSVLGASHKIQIMDTLLSLVGFASSYNSDDNLRARVQQLFGDVPAPNLLRQEVEGTRVYLAVLTRATNSGDEKLKEEAERRLVAFDSHILLNAANLLPSVAAEGQFLRSVVVVKVLSSMSEMDSAMFKRHLPEFYPYFTKLICSDQMDVRRALGDLFKLRLLSLLPSIA